MYRKLILESISRVVRDHAAALVALARLQAQAVDDPTVLHSTAIDLSDVRRCAATLEQTYLARMYAVFEAHLRDLWQQAFGRITHPKMADLLDGCAAHQNVPDDLLTTNAHRVREYRNSVVHGGEAERVTLQEARTWLCQFFGRMPPQW